MQLPAHRQQRRGYFWDRAEPRDTACRLVAFPINISRLQSCFPCSWQLQAEAEAPFEEAARPPWSSFHGPWRLQVEGGAPFAEATVSPIFARAGHSRHQAASGKEGGASFRPSSRLDSCSEVDCQLDLGRALPCYLALRCHRKWARRRMQKGSLFPVEWFASGSQLAARHSQLQHPSVQLQLYSAHLSDLLAARLVGPSLAPVGHSLVVVASESVSAAPDRIVAVPLAPV